MKAVTIDLNEIIKSNPKAASAIADMNPVDIMLAYKLTLNDATSLKSCASFTKLANTLTSKSKKPEQKHPTPANTVTVLVEYSKAGLIHKVTTPAQLGKVLETAKNNNQSYLITCGEEYKWVSQVQQNLAAGYSYLTTESVDQ